jgi:hypothetical protein
MSVKAFTGREIVKELERQRSSDSTGMVLLSFDEDTEFYRMTEADSSMNRMGYYAKERATGNLYQFEWNKDSGLVVNGVQQDPEQYEILEIFHSREV